MLNFIAIVWKNDAYLPCHRGTVSSFLSTVVDTLSADPSASLICSLMTVLSVYEFTKLWDDEKVLEHALTGLRRNPLSASVISNYIIAMQENDTICVSVYAEVWDHISDVLLLTLRSSYNGEESLLALLVAPSLCHALCSLISHSEPNLAQWILQSPWTCHLRQELRALLETPDDDLPHDSAILKERILVPAQMLLEKTKGKVDETDKNAIPDLPRLSSQFFYHTSDLGMHLILIPK
ncbi:hypothetical protein EWM64_g9245 [Hericium alpestre]|uniref:Uncharacterized protein n=1 Tax=Hericium alpestre TaxID=135208 RepID=A0A4Y9ZL17_9AGAM|nr:hypothetical protein EWM64_g9245 [Hericium alpestre]